jgi:hypothetical protein
MRKPLPSRAAASGRAHAPLPPPPLLALRPNACPLTDRDSATTAAAAAAAPQLVRRLLPPLPLPLLVLPQPAASWSRSSKSWLTAPPKAPGSRVERQLA